MKLLTGTVLAAAMLAAAPAYADRGDHDRGHGRDKHHWKHAHRGHQYYEPPRVVYRELVRHHSYYAPAKTPKAIVTRINEDMNKVMKTPQVQQNFTKYSAEMIGTTPAASQAFIKAEIEKWRKVVRAANIKEE